MYNIWLPEGTLSLSNFFTEAAWGQGQEHGGGNCLPCPFSGAAHVRAWATAYMCDTCQHHIQDNIIRYK